MPTASHLKAAFIPGCYYHMVCKSVDGILLFNEPADYHIYQERFYQFTQPFFETWSYCLLNNHSHHIIKTTDAKDFETKLLQKKHSTFSIATKSFLQNVNDEILFASMIERQMNSFLVSYVNYYNNKYSRNGGLFQSPFKRILISDDSHLEQAIIYTHANAQKHGLVNDFKMYEHSSYKEILSGKSLNIPSDAVIDFLGGKEKFQERHAAQVEYYYKSNWPSSKLE